MNKTESFQLFIDEVEGYRFDLLGEEEISEEDARTGPLTYSVPMETILSVKAV